MRVEMLSDLAAPLSERYVFEELRPSETFAGALARLPMDDLLAVAHGSSAARVDRALGTEPLDRSLEDHAALLSPAAGERLEDLAAGARRVTLARFGRTMHLYAPVYLSNECLTTCGYCGFARTLPVARKTLGEAEAVREARHLTAQGFRSLLLLTGEHEQLTGVEFLERHLRVLAGVVPSISIEVQVWGEAEYQRLRAAGCEGVGIYQETYDPGRYAEVHLGGRKRNYRWRLLGPERAARAGMRRVGIGALLGLHDDWRFEGIFVAAHARFLMRRDWGGAGAGVGARIRPPARGGPPPGGGRGPRPT